jgi:hypothetical protein
MPARGGSMDIVALVMLGSVALWFVKQLSEHGT